ncbi:DUF2254 domain-containing protein [Streptomyces sp. NBC_00490]|uniref:DUF2254 family protein n=1 Tax=Streptomyces sp. NBC_00490 TaxID=2903657 RepID=UPI002E188E27
MTQPPRARRAHSSGNHRARRARSPGAALLVVAAGALLGRVLPRRERHRPADGLSFDASSAQATLAAVSGGMITLNGFVVTAIALVVQTVTGVSSPRAVRRPRALLDRFAAAAPADRREPVVEHRDPLDRSAVGMPADPLLSPDRRRLGGAAAEGTLGDRRFFSPCA